MSGRPIIVLGDATDHGGQVIGGDMTATIEGKPIARVGDMVSCPKCNGTYPIVEGVMDTMFSTMPVAVHGHKTACGATLIGSQTLFLVHVEADNAYRSGPDPTQDRATSRASAAATSATLAESAAVGFDRRFQLLDNLTGVPLAKQSYRLHGPSGSVEGVTDEEGFTKAINTGQSANQIQVEIIGEGWPENVK
ncbi:PAAR domain-containing protein [Chitinimonas sp. BJB300]|nr:PAAR domain-containing protein [Chitinimonas sp. BJB300]